MEKTINIIKKKNSYFSFLVKNKSAGYVHSPCFRLVNNPKKMFCDSNKIIKSGKKPSSEYTPLTTYEPDEEVLKFYKIYLNDDPALSKSHYENLYKSKFDYIQNLNTSTFDQNIGKWTSLASGFNKFTGILEMQSELKEVIKIITTKITVSKETELQDLSEYYFKMGGKMIRPYLLISVSKYMYECVYGEGKDYFDSEIHKQYVAPFSACVEVLHNASLLHDDIIDNSDQRRSLATAHNVFGIRNTVFAANYIISRAANLLTELDIQHLNEIFSSMVYFLTYGEYQQSLRTFDMDNVENAFQVYMLKTYYKTASLLALSLRGIGIIYKFDEMKQRQLFNLGLHIGLVFQLVDDVIDVIYDSSSTKKPTNKDLIEGLINSYILFEMQDEKKKNESAQMVQMAKRKFKQEGDVEKTLKYLESGKGIIKTQNLALDHMIECYKILDEPFFKNNASKLSLYQCFNFLINRKY